MIVVLLSVFIHLSYASAESGSFRCIDEIDQPGEVGKSLELRVEKGWGDASMVFITPSILGSTELVELFRILEPDPYPRDASLRFDGGLENSDCQITSDSNGEILGFTCDYRLRGAGFFNLVPGNGVDIANVLVRGEKVNNSMVITHDMVFTKIDDTASQPLTFVFRSMNKCILL